MKQVTVVVHSIDSLPAHTEVHAHGTGSRIDIALYRAMHKAFAAPALQRKRVHSFRISVIVSNAPVPKPLDNDQ